MNKLDPGLIEYMTQWRHDLHSYPEFGFEEQRTADLVASRLREFGLEVLTGIGKTGVVGILKKGSSDAGIGLRADMDALKIQELNDFSHRSRHDGLMHACGHDGHSAMLLGAASYLAAEGNFDGTVYFIFQPAEEHGKGAKAMIADGLFERFQIDEVYGLHNLPGLPTGHFTTRSGAIMASESSFEIRLHGQGGHAAMPHLGVDTMLLGAQVVVALQSIVSRNLNALDETAVVSVTEFIGDGTVNVIPSRVTVKGDCRCFSDQALNRIRTSMERIVSGVCAAAGANYEFEFINTFLPTVNSQAETQQAIQAARDILGDECVIPDCDPFTISEDFSSMLRERPGCYALLGNGTESRGGCALHNPHYDFNDSLLPLGAAYWIQLVENQLVAV
jgi:hippurate hydrolase